MQGAAIATVLNLARESQKDYTFCLFRKGDKAKSLSKFEREPKFSQWSTVQQGIMFVANLQKVLMETQQSKKTSGPADHLANERTFLAWIRTSIALMGFGFVIVKFALFIKQISLALGEKVATQSNGYSAIIGVLMVALGAIMATLAYLRYRNIEKQLNENAYFPSKWLSVLVTLSIVVGSILLILYLLPNIRI